MGSHLSTPLPSTKTLPRKLRQVDNKRLNAYLDKELDARHDRSVIWQYLTAIINDPKFKADPDRYMLDWDKARGHTEELRFPEDIARSAMNHGLK